MTVRQCKFTFRFQLVASCSRVAMKKKKGFFILTGPLTTSGETMCYAPPPVRSERRVNVGIFTTPEFRSTANTLFDLLH
jgi:hypothetical protein